MLSDQQWRGGLQDGARADAALGSPQRLLEQPLAVLTPQVANHFARSHSFLPPRAPLQQRLSQQTNHGVAADSSQRPHAEIAQPQLHFELPMQDLHQPASTVKLQNLAHRQRQVGREQIQGLAAPAVTEVSSPPKSDLPEQLRPNLSRRRTPQTQAVIARSGSGSTARLMAPPPGGERPFPMIRRGHAVEVTAPVAAMLWECRTHQGGRAFAWSPTNPCSAIGVVPASRTWAEKTLQGSSVRARPY